MDVTPQCQTSSLRDPTKSVRKVESHTCPWHPSRENRRKVRWYQAWHTLALIKSETDMFRSFCKDIKPLPKPRHWLFGKGLSEESVWHNQVCRGLSKRNSTAHRCYGKSKTLGLFQNNSLKVVGRWRIQHHINTITVHESFHIRMSYSHSTDLCKEKKLHILVPCFLAAFLLWQCPRQP